MASLLLSESKSFPWYSSNRLLFRFHWPGLGYIAAHKPPILRKAEKSENRIVLLVFQKWSVVPEVNKLVSWAKSGGCQQGRRKGSFWVSDQWCLPQHPTGNLSCPVVALNINLLLTLLQLFSPWRVPEAFRGDISRQKFQTEYSKQLPSILNSLEVKSWRLQPKSCYAVVMFFLSICVFHFVAMNIRLKGWKTHCTDNSAIFRPEKCQLLNRS